MVHITFQCLESDIRQNINSYALSSNSIATSLNALSNINAPIRLGRERPPLYDVEKALQLAVSEA